MSALRLARAATGRRHVLKFAGAYHGHVDGLLAEAGSGLATQGLPASAGVDEATVETTVIVPWNDPDAVREACRRYELAAILAEPIPANMGVVPPGPGLSGAAARVRRPQRRAADLRRGHHAASGWRRGGAQERYDVLPDLTILGKIVGGGLPGGGLRRCPGADGAGGPGGRRLPGRDAVGEPTGHGGRAGHAASCWTHDAYRRLDRTTERCWPTGSAGRGAGRRPVQVQAVTGPAHPVLLRLTRASTTPGAAACDLEAYGELVPGAAGPGRVSAALAVRGLVSLAGPHRRGRGAHRRRPPGAPSRSWAREGAGRGAAAQGGILADSVRPGRQTATTVGASWPTRAARGPAGGRASRPTTSCCSR